jgi:hypothetical protein
MAVDLGKLILAGVGLYVAAEILDSLFGEERDTVNYALKSKKGVVLYHGIAYEDRFDFRIDEHERDGKDFHECIYDFPKPRIKARRLEKKLIKQDRPKYNYQHNRD